jgi:hypothetical protein
MSRLEPAVSTPRKLLVSGMLTLVAACLFSIGASMLVLAWTRPGGAPACPPATPPPAVEPVAPVVAPVVATAPVPGPPAPLVLAEDPADEEPVLDVHVGDAGGEDLPAELRQAVSAEDTAELVERLRGWLADGYGGEIGIAHRRGVLFVESEEDRGDDPPYPRSAAAEAARVCGTATTWLRSHLRRHLARVVAPGFGLACSGNVCTYGGMEYAPSGTVVFRRSVRDDGYARWTLDAWIQSYEAGLGPEYAEANHRFVQASLRRLAGTGCAGEPDRVD